MVAFESEFLGKLKPYKILNCNYGSISHLPGSKMIDDEDHLIGKREAYKLLVQTHKPEDIVFITEKIDGMNCGVYRSGNKLFPLTRKGYDCRNNPTWWIRNFAKYVEDNAERFLDLLEEDERICGEWMIHQHTLRYDIKREPFIAFDIIKNQFKRERYFNFLKRIEKFNFEHTGIVHIGTAMDTETAMRLLGKGFHGVIDGKPEGVVYRYETKDGWYCNAKYVANQLLGVEGTFKADNPLAVNHVKSRYKKYYKYDYFGYDTEVHMED